MENHKFVFICGLHKSGTSVFEKTLAEHPDIFMCRGKPRRFTLTTDNYFFMGHPKCSFNKIEDVHFIEDRQVRPSQLIDLDGDGCREFITLSQRLNLNSLMDYFLRGRVVVDFAVRRINKNGIYESKPYCIKKLSIKVETEEGSPAAASGGLLRRPRRP